MCPKGDDPYSMNQEYSSINLAIRKSSGTAFSGTIGIEFQNEVLLLSLTTAVLTDGCTAAFASSSKFSSVLCSCTKSLAVFWQCDIVFQAWPVLPTDNNLFTHEGNPKSSEFSCDISNAEPSDVYCTFSDTDSNADLKGAWPSYLFNHILFLLRIAFLACTQNTLCVVIGAYAISQQEYVNALLASMVSTAPPTHICRTVKRLFLNRLRTSSQLCLKYLQR